MLFGLIYSVSLQRLHLGGMMDYWQRYSSFEDALIETARTRAQRFPKQSKARFAEFLLQLAHLSIHFVPLYERAKHGMSEQGKEVVRNILRDEIPSKGPTHQDNRVADLLRLGVPLHQILNTFPTERTSQTIRNLFDLVRYPQDDYELVALVGLRVAGEVMVSVQYEPIAQTLEDFGLPRRQQQFYYPHYEHDKKGAKEDGHTEEFDVHLQGLIVDERMLQLAMQAAVAGYEVRFGIHDQFV